MAGGFGTRLRPLTANVPKPMVPLGNKPIMEHTVELLKAHGFDELLILLYFLPEAITDYFGDGSHWGVRIEYVRPGADLGTAGAVRFATEALGEPVLVIFGFFWRIVPIPALVVLGLWIVVQVLNSLITFGGGEPGGVAFLAHVGGFVTGMVLIVRFRQRPRLASGHH